LLLATLLIFCCTAPSSDAPETSTVQVNVNAHIAKEGSAPNSEMHFLPDSPAAKNDFTFDSDTTPALPAAGITPNSQPLSRAPVKPATRGNYETARQLGIWYGLMAAGHAAAVYDAYTTRGAISGGYGSEGDPFMRPFSHSNSVYAATQVSPAIMDYLGHRMMTSEHKWMWRMWWAPQVVGSSMSLSAGIHNSRLIR
jgi:hypothetical protein